LTGRRLQLRIWARVSFLLQRKEGTTSNPPQKVMIKGTGGFMKTTKELLGARIKELRKARGLSQDQLLERVNIDSKHLSRIEVGKSYPSLDTLEKIARALNVEIKDLFEYMHEVKGKELTENINRLLKESDEEKLRLILKIIRAIVR
jgi:transcriptional regulator with XRE-family HTH domain